MKDSKEYTLDFLIRTAEAISQTFGSSCETLVHDMRQPGHPIVAIFNSHISGRKVGSTMDIFGSDAYHSKSKNETAPQIKKSLKLDQDVVNSLAITKKNTYIKSTTINYIGDDYHYALGINFDYTSISSAMSTLIDLTSISKDLSEHISGVEHSQLEDLFDECLALIGKPIASMKKNDKLKLISLLMKRNAFSFQKSVLFVAEKLNVSRYTVYKYCHEVDSNINLKNE